MTGQRRVTFVVGSPRSGFGVVASVLRALGMVVPGLAEDAPGTEPPFVADLLTELLERSHTDAYDARPQAWFDTGRLGNYEPLRVRTGTWLERAFDDAAALPVSPQRPDVVRTELVVAEPRLARFHGTVRAAALRAGAEPSFVVPLRPAADVVRSDPRFPTAVTPFSAPPTDAQRLAAWTSTVLHVERATRGDARVLVRTADVLADWTGPLQALGRTLGLTSVANAHANEVRAVSSVLDAGRFRTGARLDDVDAPARLREIAGAAEHALDRLAGPDAAGNEPDAALLAELDDVRTAYTDYYESAEAVAASTAANAYRLGRGDALEERAPAPAVPAAPAETPDPGETGVAAKARRVFGRG